MAVEREIYFHVDDISNLLTNLQNNQRGLIQNNEGITKNHEMVYKYLDDTYVIANQKFYDDSAGVWVLADVEFGNTEVQDITSVTLNHADLTAGIPLSQSGVSALHPDFITAGKTSLVGSLNYLKDYIDGTSVTGLWADQGGGVIKPKPAYTKIDTASGLQDTFVTTAIPLGESGETGLSVEFDAVSIIGAINENRGLIGDGSDWVRSLIVGDAYELSPKLLPSEETISVNVGESFTDDFGKLAGSWFNVTSPGNTDWDAALYAETSGDDSFLGNINHIYNKIVDIADDEIFWYRYVDGTEEVTIQKATSTPGITAQTIHIKEGIRDYYAGPIPLGDVGNATLDPFFTGTSIYEAFNELAYDVQYTLPYPQGIYYNGNPSEPRALAQSTELYIPEGDLDIFEGKLDFFIPKYEVKGGNNRYVCIDFSPEFAIDFDEVSPGGGQNGTELHYEFTGTSSANSYDMYFGTQKEKTAAIDFINAIYLRAGQVFIQNSTTSTDLFTLASSGLTGYGEFHAVRTSTNYSLTTGVLTKINFNGEYYDPDGRFNLTNDEYTVNQEGWYTFTGGILLYMPASSQAVLELHLNGTSIATQSEYTGYADTIHLNVAFSGYLASGDVVDLRIVQYTGFTATVYADDNTFFSGWGVY